MLRKLPIWVGALLALIFIGGNLFLFPPLPNLPEIAKGLPSNFSEADEEFNRRVLAAFPMPLTVEELTDRLSEQGFKVYAENNYGNFEQSGFPCTLIWRIHWEEVDGAVSEMTSKYGGICL